MLLGTSTRVRLGALAVAAFLLCAAGGAQAVVVFSDDFVDGNLFDGPVWSLGAINVINSGQGDSFGQGVSSMAGNTDNSLTLFDTETTSSAAQTNFSIRSTASFTVTMPATYDVSYLAKTSICDGCDPEAEVLIDNVLRQTLVENPVFQTLGFSLFLGAGAHTITLALDMPQTLFSGTIAAFFDDVEISAPMQAVPEPGALLLFAVGLAGLAVVRVIGGCLRSAARAD